jgi:phosphoribosylanthranilate isomerase|tara:strand:+ start:2482 stop:3015 length:534 start_codon:yes stop_codon:yes gene_type:complete
MMGISAAVAVGREVPLLVDLVGVFVDPVPGQVETVLDQVPLTILQFHGDETRAACEQFGLPYIKAIRMKPEIDPLKALESHPKAAALLLDTFCEEVHGGTGVAFDWHQACVESTVPIIVAGGLRVANVAQALHQSGAWGVDVSTGVETGPGEKNAQMIVDFCNAVRDYDTQRQGESA